MILPLTGALLDDAWPWVELQLSRFPALCYTPAEVRERADKSLITIWALLVAERPETVIMLEKSVDGSGEMLYAGGRMNRAMVAEVIGMAHQWAGWNEIHTLTVRGRPGWDRVLKPYGFTREGDQWAAPAKKT